MDFRIWFNNGIKPAKRVSLNFRGNRTYDAYLCNHSHFKTLSGLGNITVMADYGDRVKESNEGNNIFTKKDVRFVEVTGIRLEVSPLGTVVGPGMVKQFKIKAHISFQGRGTVVTKYNWFQRNTGGVHFPAGKEETLYTALPQTGSTRFIKTVVKDYLVNFHKPWQGKTISYYLKLITTWPNRKISKEIRFGVKYIK